MSLKIENSRRVDESRPVCMGLKLSVIIGQQYRVYKKKLNRFEIALNFAKQPLVSSFLCI